MMPALRLYQARRGKPHHWLHDHWPARVSCEMFTLRRTSSSRPHTMPVTPNKERPKNQGPKGSNYNNIQNKTSKRGHAMYETAFPRGTCRHTNGTANGP